MLQSLSIILKISHVYINFIIVLISLLLTYNLHTHIATYYKIVFVNFDIYSSIS